MRKKANHPQWTLDQKRPGTELRCIRGRYYLYECSSFYDREKKYGLSLEHIFYFCHNSKYVRK